MRARAEAHARVPGKRVRDPVVAEHAAGHLAAAKPAPTGLLLAAIDRRRSVQSPDDLGWRARNGDALHLRHRQKPRPTIW